MTTIYPDFPDYMTDEEIENMDYEEVLNYCKEEIDEEPTREEIRDDEHMLDVLDDKRYAFIEGRKSRLG